MRNKLIIALIGLAVVGGAYWRWQSGPVAWVEKVTRGTAVYAVPGSVSVTAQAQSDLKSEAAGRVARSALEVGRQVKTGDFLLALDTADVELEIQQEENQLRNLRERVALGSPLKYDWESGRALLSAMQSQEKFGSVSADEIARQERLVKQIEQKMAVEKVENERLIAEHENTLSVLRRRMAKMTFTAPFDGVISAFSVYPGDLVAVNASLATIISTGRTVEAKVTEENFADIKVGQTASVRFLGYGKQVFPATVSKILPTADAQTQRYSVWLDVQIPREKLVPGLTGEVTIVIDQRAGQLIAPRRAIRGGEVLVVKHGRIEVRQVEVGYTALNRAEITSGLAEGDLVVVEQLELFRNGDRVSPELVQ